MLQGGCWRLDCFSGLAVVIVVANHLMANLPFKLLGEEAPQAQPSFIFLHHLLFVMNSIVGVKD